VVEKSASTTDTPECNRPSRTLHDRTGFDREFPTHRGHQLQGRGERIRAEIGRGDGGVILREKVWHPSTDVFPVTVAAGSTIVVSCQLFDGGDAADAILRLSALQVGAIN